MNLGNFKMKKASVALVGILLLIGSYQPLWAQKEKYHSIFLYNFSKYIKWPDSKNSDVFVIGVFGKSDIQKELKAMAASKKINGMSIEIRQFNSIADISGCHILYVSASASSKIDQVLSKTNQEPILIVTDSPGMAMEGAAINFVDEGGKIRFELNQKNAESKGLKIAGALANLAILV